MARRSRTSVLKRQREAAKRARERRKAEKAALKRERRHGKKAGTKMASRDELIALGVIEPEPENPGQEKAEGEGAEDTDTPASAD